jgi:hypothetical protein
MTYELIRQTIEELTKASFPPPLTVAQPATLSLAKHMLEKLNRKGIYPEENIVKILLAENGWKEKDIKYFIKRLNKHLQPE